MGAPGHKPTAWRKRPDILVHTHDRASQRAQQRLLGQPLDADEACLHGVGALHLATQRLRQQLTAKADPENGRGCFERHLEPLSLGGQKRIQSVV